MRKLPNTDCVIQVGYGRGFVFGSDHRRFVLTAAHCLPHLPPANAHSYLKERTYEDLLGPLGGKNTVGAECLFVDPVADIAVLGVPDTQELYEEAESFENLVNSCRPLRIADAQSGNGWMLSLDNSWLPISVAVCGTWSPTLEIDPTRNGQSGSPILSRSGQAIGMIVIGGEGNPILKYALPGWLLKLVKTPYWYIRDSLG